jgi:hypothetical protein
VGRRDIAQHPEQRLGVVEVVGEEQRTRRPHAPGSIARVVPRR